MRTGENIFKRKDGRWEARYHKGRDSSGKLLYGFCYGKTYTEAKAKMEEAKQHKEWIISTPYTSRQTFGSCCNSWLEMNALRLHAASCVKYQAILEKYIKPSFGGFFPEELNSQMISTFSRRLLYEEKLAPKTVKDILVILHSVLTYTQKQFPGKMPAIEIVYPREKPSKIRVLSIPEQKTLTRYLLEDNNRPKYGILLSLWTGIRIGELCALRRRNISLDEQELSVEATMQRLKSNNPDTSAKTEIIIGPPKSCASVRTIPLTEPAAELCRAIISDEEDAFILTGTTHYMEPRTLQNHFQKYIKECKLENVHFHTLRHTFATRCIEAGMDVKTLSEILGHSSANITINRYVHCSMEMKRRNMEKLNMDNLQ